MFRRYLSRLPRTAINESVTNLYRILVEASEGEAGKYFRKVVKAASPEVQRYLHDVTVETMDEKCPEEPKENWLQWLWIWFRQDFGLRNDDTVYFAPGIARIMFADADTLDRFDYEPHQTLSHKAETLSKLVHYIQTAHKDSYTRYLVDKETGEPATFDTLKEKFGDALRQHGEDMKKKLETLDYTPNNYVIVELDDFATASKFSKYTLLHPNNPESGWCHLEDAGTFGFYKGGGNVRLYLAYKPGFENLKPGDKGYGQSMLGIDVGPGDELIHCNNRYNHENDPELDNKKNKPGDYRFDAEELSLLLGGPFYKFCPYYTAEERKERGIFTPEDFETALANGEEIPKDLYFLKSSLDNGDKIISVASQENVIRNGKLLFPKWYETVSVLEFNDELLYMVWNQGKVTLYTMDLRRFIDDWFDDIYHTGDDSKYLLVLKNDFRNLLDASGHLVYKNWYRSLPIRISSKFSVGYGTDQKYHLIDMHGNQIDGIAMDDIESETDSYCYIRNNGKTNFLSFDTLRPMLNPWCDAFLPYENQYGKFYLARLTSEESFDEDRYNIVDCSNPDHYLLKKWASSYDFFENTRYAIFAYDNPKTNQSTYYRFDTETKMLLDNNTFSKENQTPANVDHISHGLQPNTYVITAKFGNDTKSNIYKDNQPLLKQWADYISIEDQYYLIEYDEKYTVANEDGQLLLANLYDRIYKIYSDKCIIVSTGQQPEKYNIICNGNPLFKDWVGLIRNSFDPNNTAIEPYTEWILVQQNQQYNILKPDCSWVFDKWKTESDLLTEFPEFTNVIK